MKKLIAGIIIGVALTATTNVFADSIKEYILTKADYPIMVNGQKYQNTDLPVLSYKGSTYMPLKAVGEVLGVSAAWNNTMQRVEISGSGSNVAVNGSQTQSTPTNQTSGSSTSPAKPELLKNYLSGTSVPAIKYQGVVYLPLVGGLNKYDVNLKKIPVPDSSIVEFARSNIQVKLSSKMTSGDDGFFYEGSIYLKESLFAAASKESVAYIEQLKQSLDQSYDLFKKVFPVTNKRLEEDNDIRTEVTHTDLDVETFFTWWNGLGDKRKQYTEEYAKELQKLNPDHPITLLVQYSNSKYFLLSASDINETGKVTYSNVSKIANPNPDQSSIK
ncbi:stalk domain-containing protein [Paenibacillus sp. sgz500958]|uniref:stalk domain-containing protein n=1 Tax=Paenibacillus sp. sgz500958 TaxID=3242475 RepID=UPI0036D3DB76